MQRTVVSPMSRPRLPPDPPPTKSAVADFVVRNGQLAQGELAGGGFAPQPLTEMWNTCCRKSRSHNFEFRD